jgi:hypothetical protein
VNFESRIRIYPSKRVIKPISHRLVLRTTLFPWLSVAAHRRQWIPYMSDWILSRKFILTADGVSECKVFVQWRKERVQGTCVAQAAQGNPYWIALRLDMLGALWLPLYTHTSTVLLPLTYNALTPSPVTWTRNIDGTKNSVRGLDGAALRGDKRRRLYHWISRYPGLLLFNLSVLYWRRCD